MAKILIVPDGGSTHRMTVEDQNAGMADWDGVEPWYVATCTCGTQGTDRGNFEDTMQYAVVHVEGAHE